ncbi:ligase-associated DNA damage response DEXH box helicase [Pontibacter sp. G13]|uniref:ligase-associated DNA damage response DEXH box helicase n=1 Tax=Pontibacter sp. G13 TaxID=3074898 RepID=UPI00288C3BB4|nr:ligase-associated DNA damage response DEXH box helicase [Pontibacter sp. G13]WNJ19955.1 ligase-associated DNA damage response DEXH box helicase [Pontibacter sp. G13]
MNRNQALLHAKQWFKERKWRPFPFQLETWEAFLDGKNGMLNAPTGSGKTYGLWVPIVLDYLIRYPDHAHNPPKGLKAIWITPLRSLSEEIRQATQRFAAEMGTHIRVETRTGDTSSAQRAKQKRNMPDLLITTPESLHLLLASKGYARVFRDVTAVVIDEWHELLGSKRGVQVELALSRLKTVSPHLRIWGISATIGNLDQAMDVLLGPESAARQHAVMVRSNIEKRIKVHSIIPDEMETFPWRGHLGIHLLEEVVEIIRNSRSTLLFTNTRAQCEIWFQKILDAHPEFAGTLAMHHGSIEKEMRLWVEDAIRNDQLKAVVCTSSLDLGVDFAPVETIIQIGGPKGVARFLQRAGRSGHAPGRESVIHFLPTHAIELIEASALRKAAKIQAVEDRVPYLQSMDVLIQYLVTLSVSDGFFPEEIWPEVKSTFCFQSINKAQWFWVLDFITRGSQSLQAYDEFRKVEIEEDGRYKVHQRGIAARHRMQIGTIVGDGALTVKYLKGGRIGTIEEWFISKLSPGDVFTFAGKNLELHSIKHMQVLVKRSKSKKAKVATWMGGRMTFSAQMSEMLRQELYEFHGDSPSRELLALHHIFERQMQESIVPGPDQLLIETFKTRDGYHTLIYPFEGRFVHEAMASLLAYRVSLLMPITFSLAYNDYGFDLLSDKPWDIQQLLDNELFTPQHLNEDLNHSLNATEMAKRKFRDIAVISGLVFSGYPHERKQGKHLQSSSQLLFKVFRDYEPDNLLFQQAFTETFEHQLEEGRLQLALDRIMSQEIVWKDCRKPTPFSFPIITDRLREKLSSEKLADRIKRMTLSLGS